MVLISADKCAKVTTTQNTPKKPHFQITPGKMCMHPYSCYIILSYVYACI